MDNVDYLKMPPGKKNAYFFNPVQPMKNIVECWKDFFGYFNTLETHSAMGKTNRKIYFL